MMRLGRRWSAARQAYTPRWWPPFLLSLPVLVFELHVWPQPTTLVGGVVAGAVPSFVLGHARWSWWRRRHPVLSPEEFLAARRRSAPLN